MRTTHRIGTAGIAVLLALGGAACSDDGDTTGTDGGEEVVEDVVDNADEVGTEEGTGTEEPNTGDDVGDESPGASASETSTSG